MLLKDRITDDMKSAMRARDKERLSAIRLILAEIKRVEVDERIEVDDDRVHGILNKMVKQRRDSIQQFSKADRADLVATEEAELRVIAEYLPAQMNKEEVEAIIDEVIGDSGAAGMADMGRVMAVLRPRLEGRADLGAASASVRQRLQK